MCVLGKVTSIILSVIILFGVGSCSRGNENDEIPTLVWLIPGDLPADLPLVMEEANKITVEKIGAKIDLQFINEKSYTEKMNTYMATSKEYDLAFAGYVNPMINAAEKRGIMPLDELLETVPKLKETMPEYFWDLVKYDGKIYAVPNCQVLPTALCIQFDKTFFEKFNLSLGQFENLEDCEIFFECVKRYVEENNIDNLYGFKPSKIDSVPIAFDYWIDKYQKIDDVFFTKDENGYWHGISIYESDEYWRGVKKLYEWYKKGYISPDIVDKNTTNKNYSLSSVQVYKPGIEYIGFDSYSKLIQKPVVNICNAMTVISKNCKSPELAIKLIELINTDKEFFNLLCLGIEGKNYEKVGDNFYKRIDSGYIVNSAWKFGNQFNEYIPKDGDPDVWEVTKEYNNSATFSPFIGFSIDNSAIRTELQAVEEVINAYSFMELGVANPDDYYNDFLNKLKIAGIDKIISEYEKQINEFMSDKK